MAIVVVAVGLCAYLFVGTTKDDDADAAEAPTERKQEPVGGAASGEPIGPDKATTTTETTLDLADPGRSEGDAESIDDLATEVTNRWQFCVAFQGIYPLELGLMETLVDEDTGGAAAAVEEHRAGWRAGVHSLIESTSGSLNRDVLRYQAVYEEIMDVVLDPASVASYEDALALQDRWADAALAGGRITAASAAVCG